MADESFSPAYEFGPFRVETAPHRLLRAGEPVALTPKAFEVLLVLLERRGRVVEKDELMQALWPDSVVEEANLTVNVSALRKALGEGRGDHPYIATVPGRGYKFAADVREAGGAPAELLVARKTSGRLIIEEVEETNEPPAAAFRLRGQQLFGRLRRHPRIVVISFVAPLAVVLAAFFYFHRAPALTERDTILLADFENRTGDAVFDGTLKQALAVQLEQSPFLNIFPDERARETMKLMKRAPDERVTGSVAREICQRQNLKAFLAGSIASLGRDYVLTLEAVNAQSGEIIAREQRDAEGREQVLRALGRAATRMRERLGESLRSIEKFDAPIEQATTASLDALKAYALGVEQHRQGKYLEAIPFYKRAIELDADFALACSSLSGAYSNTFQTEQEIACAEKAYQLRNRVSEREKLNITGRYYLSATGEVDKAIETFEVWKRLYPRSYTPVNNLAFEYLTVGQYEKAVAEAREAIRLDPAPSQAYANLGRALLRLNRFDEAEQVLQRATAQTPGSSAMHADLFTLAFLRGDAAAMQQQLDWRKGRPSEYAAFEEQAEVAALQGRLKQAREFLLRAQELEQRRGLNEVVAISRALAALRQAMAGQCEQVARETAEALSVERNLRSLRASARALALCGAGAQSQTLADELARRYPKDTLLNAVWLPVIRANIELERGHPEVALQLLRSVGADEAASDFWVPYLRAQACLRQHKPGEAMTELQKILDHRGYDPLSPFYPRAYLELARATALAGDTARSRQSYEAFLSLWKDADPDLGLLREAKKEYEKMRSDSVR
ncbi:MAG TPA: winged helix-turn-helix domain-containing protein [Blastocatellia bacterium]|nr:winged helix-turn-helix domain-containing protein [Blastocatellia bacterium]